MTHARNRRRRPARRAAFRDPKPVILVVTEGEVTEPEYLRGYESACRNARVNIEFGPEHGVPKTLVELAKQSKQEAESRAKSEKDANLAYDSVWCVFDIDEHPAVGEAQQMARDNGIDLAISNPCFELWLLLHFRDNPGMNDRTQVRAMLAKYVPDYDKHVEYANYAAGYHEAVKRASRMDKAAEKAGESNRNPTTGVYRLTESIRGDAAAHP